MQFKIKDIVEIISNKPMKFKDTRLFGKIVNINGEYIYVKPKYQRYIMELYRSEIKHVNQ